MRTPVLKSGYLLDVGTAIPIFLFLEDNNIRYTDKPTFVNLQEGGDGCVLIDKWRYSI